MKNDHKDDYISCKYCFQRFRKHELKHDCMYNCETGEKSMVCELVCPKCSKSDCVMEITK
jgi:hypothetical protein